MRLKIEMACSSRLRPTASGSPASFSDPFDPIFSLRARAEAHARVRAGLPGAVPWQSRR